LFITWPRNTFDHFRWTSIEPESPELRIPKMGFHRALLTIAVLLASCSTVPTPTPPAPTEQTLSSGTFYNVVHDGSGQATIVKKTDGSRVLRFTNFSVTNGPVLEVWLSAATRPTNNAAISGAAYLSLGALKAVNGDQEYAIPTIANLADFQSVTVWCVQFKVNFASAALN
jgi:Electron transfer DM13